MIILFLCQNSVETDELYTVLKVNRIQGHSAEISLFIQFFRDNHFQYISDVQEGIITYYQGPISYMDCPELGLLHF